MDWTRYRCLALIALGYTCATVSAAGGELAAYPGAEVVDTRQDLVAKSRPVILGSLNKIRNQLEPEKVEYVTGIRSSITTFIPNERRTTLVRDFYREQLQAAGQILFECSGRDCGSSNYWANTIFEAAILYGPEEYQHYMLARMNSGEYLVVYVAMRGTRKLYVYTETTTPKGGGSVAAELKKGLRHVFRSVDVDKVVAAIADLLPTQDDKVAYLVVHQGLVDGEDVDSAIKRSQRIADQISRRANYPGLVARGLGPLAPSDTYGSNRVELILP